MFQFLAQQAQGEDALGRMILHLTLVSTCRPCAQANLSNLSPPFTDSLADGSARPSALTETSARRVLAAAFVILFAWRFGNAISRF